MIAGAANNQLLDSPMGDALAERGIVYAPDFAINAGGVINIGEELGRPYDAARAREAVGRIERTLELVFAQARERRASPRTVPPSASPSSASQTRSSSVRPRQTLRRRRPAW